MKNRIKDNIDNYLNASYAPYAILVNGKWGSGKTYYFQEEFTLAEDKKKIYVSANGISSTEELAKEILFQRYVNGNKEGTERNLVDIGKTAGIGLINHLTKGVIDSEKFVEQALKLIKLNKNDVLILDDIERIKDPLDYETLLGFVSRNFLEKENAVKVILIANEEFLSKREDSKYYFKIKEKTIWRTLNYQTEIPAVFKRLASNFKDIKTSLLQNEELIIKLLSRYKIQNLRTVLFFFGVLEFIQKKTNKNIFEQDSLGILLNSTLIICNEYKEGYLSSNSEGFAYLRTESPVVQFEYDFEGIDLFDKKEKDEKNPEQERQNKLAQYFSSKYLFPNEPKYKFIESLIKYVQTSDLDVPELINEIDLLNKDIITETEETRLLNSLSDISKLDTEEFEETWNQIIDAISKDLYDYHELEFILYTYGKYSKWLDFPRNQEFQDALNQAIPKSELSERKRYNPYYGFKLEIKEESEIFTRMIVVLEDRSQVLLRNSRKDELERLLLNLTIEEPINFVSLGNFFANASQEKIGELLEVIVSNAKRTSDFSRTLYDAKREFRMHRTSTHFERNVTHFRSTLKERIQERTPQSLSLIGIERVFDEYIMN